jgi:hypothetical protein
MDLEDIPNNDQNSVSNEIERQKIEAELNAINHDSGGKTVDPKKGLAAVMTGLDAVTKEASSKESAGQGSATEDTSSNPYASDSDSDSGSYYVTDPLVASILAGVTNLTSKTELMKATSDMQEKLSDLTTKVAQSGRDWMQNFYQYGLVASDGSASMGSYDAGTAHKPGDVSVVDFKIANGKISMSINGGVTWETLGPDSLIEGTPSDTLIAAAFPNYTTSGLNSGELAYLSQQFYDAGFKTAQGPVQFQGILINNGTTEGGGTGLQAASSGDMQALMSQWSYVQQTANSNNQTIQTTSNLPTAMQSNTNSDIGNSTQSRQGVEGCLDSTANLITGWTR